MSKRQLLLLLAVQLILPMGSGCRTSRSSVDNNSPDRNSAEATHWIRENLDFSVKQYKYLAESTKAAGADFPRTLKDDGELLLVPATDWTSGFFPGGLWYLYEYSNDQSLKDLALHFTYLLENQRTNTSTHDLGFMIMSSYGHAYRLTGDENLKPVIVDTAETLARRFNAQTGCTRSWDFGAWKSPVIVDNVMNMELLYWSGAASKKPTLIAMANSHLDTTLKNHFRPDGSSFHLVDYDPQTGAVLKRQTVQGYADSSSWARGQGWALYGYTMGYRFTKNPLYLDQAQRTADFILSHKNMPNNLVPPWDFDVPMARTAPRDTSAAAIYASALVELSEYAEGERKTRYLAAADTILKSLSTARYRAEKVGDLGGFVLNHAVGWMSGNGDVDRPLVYGDYYYIEALIRRLKLAEQQAS